MADSTQGSRGAFVVVYLIFVALIGVPVLLAELSVGRASQRNPVGAFKALLPRSWWPAVGGLGVVTGFAILAFYSVVAGWTLGYVWLAATGQLTGVDAEESKKLYEGLTGDPARAIGLSFAFLALTVLVVRGGVHRGIERAAKLLMPVFFLLLVGLTIRSVTLEGSGKGIDFLLHFDFSKLKPTVILDALGQALFSLSLGMGAMITYGSYLQKKENLAAAGITVAVFDTGIALLAGFMIFPALFAAGGEPGAGPALVFQTVPTILDNLPFGSAFGVAFYVLLGVAALTSTISLLEVVTAYFVDERGWSRNKAVFVVGGACFLLAIPSAVWGSFLGWQDTIFGNFSLALGALLLCVFVGWAWGVPKAFEEMEHGSFLPAPLARLELGTDGRALWRILVRFVCPVAVAAAFAFLIYSKLFAPG